MEEGKEIRDGWTGGQKLGGEVREKAAGFNGVLGN